MKKIEVQGSLTFENHGYLYTVTSDVYSWDPDHLYNANEYVLYKGKLLQARIRTPGLWLCNFEPVKPNDTVTKYATNDDLQPIYKSLDEIKAKLGISEEDPLDPWFSQPQCPPPEDESKPEPDENTDEILQRLDTIEQTYVRTINNTPAVGGNINIDYDGTVTPPESTILRWVDGKLIFDKDKSIVYTADDVQFNVLSFDNGVQLGSDSLHVNIDSVDGLTVNGTPVVTSETVVDLINDQNIHGRKHFDKIFTTESPQEDHQVPNSKWVKDVVDHAIVEAVKPNLSKETVYYIDSRTVLDTQDGSKDAPFKSLKNAIDYIKTINLNFNSITIEFLSRYTDDSSMVELPDFGSYINVVSKTGLDVELPPLYITGKWRFDGVTFTDNKLAQYPIEIDGGYCKLYNVKVALRTPAPGTNAIFVHNTGVVQLAPLGSLVIKNESNVNVQTAICIDAGVLLGNEDVHSNVGEPNSITISNDNSSFAVAMMAKHGARCLYLENTKYSYGSALPYVAKQASVIQGLIHRGEGEQDSSSIVAS